MSVKWTPDQQKVIDLRDCNILVSAAAGSGKTAVLVERIVGRILESEHPLDIDRLLVVTYTDAAASEMRERILNKLQELSRLYPENSHLHRQLGLIYHANISTIHGFCAKVIKENVHLLEIDADYRVGEEGELELMKSEAIQNVMEVYYGNKREDFMTLLEWLSPNKDDKILMQQVINLYMYASSYPLPKMWFDQALSLYSPSANEEMYVSYALEIIKKRVRDVLQELHIAKKVCEEPDGPAPYLVAIEDDIEYCKQLLSLSYYDLESLIVGHKWKAFKSITAKQEHIDLDKKKYVANLRSGVKEIFKKIVESFFFLPIEKMKEDLYSCFPIANILIELAKAFSDEFQRLKKRNHVIDFSDMEHFALEILSQEREGTLQPSNVALHYQEVFEEVMVDEYQDSNLLQEVMLDFVSRTSRGEHNRFMVGDVKQSIYRFRLARPDIFMEKYREYQKEDETKQRVDLHQNFRSRKEIIDVVNFLFSQLMAEDMGGVLYDDLARLNAGADYPDGEGHDTELLLGEKVYANEEGETCKIKGASAEAEFEALGIARRIQALLDEEIVTDKETKCLRKAKYGDIVVLMRNAKTSINTYKKVFMEAGIPVQVNEKTGYYETKEISLLLNYLQVIDNPNTDIPLAAVMVSFLGGFTENELARIRSLNQKITFYEVVQDYKNSADEDDLKVRVVDFLDRIDRYRKISTYLPLHELIWRIIKDTHFLSYCGTLVGGEQRIANIEMLLSKARDFEAGSYTGLYNFVQYMRKLEDHQINEGEADISGAQVDKVRLMTIHKSKGLEFPIVIVASMGKEIRVTADGGIPKHPTMGFGLDVIDVERRTKSSTLVKGILQQDLRIENKGEELRILYVALTRAKEKLIISGLADSYMDILAKYAKVQSFTEEILPFSLRLDAKSFLEWVIAALIRQKEGEEVISPIIYNQGMLSEVARKEAMQKDFFAKKTWEELTSLDKGKVFCSGIQEKLKRQFDYVYPYPDNGRRKVKYTVSELKKLGGLSLEEAGDLLVEEETMVPLLPKFLQSEPNAMTGASRGSAYHTFLELLDYTKNYDSNLLKKELNTLKETNKLSKEMTEAIRIADILDFLQSSLGRRMCEAEKEGKLYKEQPFLMEGEDGILIQGIIDVYFEEEGSLVIMDYKTDRVNNSEELRERYQTQLCYYAKALEQLTDKEVKQKIIYSFALKEEVEV